MKKIGVILLIGLICITMVACKKQENVGNAEEQKPVQEIVKNPSEQLPIIYTQIEDGAGNKFLSNIIEIRTEEIDTKLKHQIEDENSELSLDTINSLNEQYKAIIISGQSHNLESFTSGRKKPEEDFKLYIGNERIDTLGDILFIKDSEEQAKLALIVEKKHFKTGLLQLEIEQYINGDKNYIFVDIVE